MNLHQNVAGIDIRASSNAQFAVNLILAFRSYMLDLYRLVSLVPEKEAFACTGAAISSSKGQEQAGDTEEGEGSGLNLSALLLPCTTLLDAYHLGADLRLASPRSVEGQERFAKQVRFLVVFSRTFQF